MLLQKSVVGNSRSGLAQFAQVKANREAANISEEVHQAILSRSGEMAMFANAGLIPQDVYQEFDNVTVVRFREDDGDVFLNDLLPLSKSVNIGKTVSKFRMASDAGIARSSMTGQQGVLMDQVEFTYDGTIIPIHDAGFGRNFREFNAQQSEGFDALIDDNRETVATVRAHLAEAFMEGHLDGDGNFIKVDALDWQGMRHDSRVAAVDLGAGGINFDFTDNTKTGAQIKAAFIQVRDTLWITNKCSKDVTYYISKAMASNFERKFSTQYDARTIQQELADLMNVATLKVSSKLVGNEFMGFPLDGSSVKPIVGMGMNTVAMPRQMYNSNYEFAVWTATGFQVTNDFAGLTCAIMARDLT